MAAMKQQFVFAREHRNVIMSIWYLEMLVLEYVRNLAFSHYTMDLCEVCGNKRALIKHDKHSQNHFIL